MRPQSSSSKKTEISKSLLFKDDNTSSMPNLKKGFKKSDSVCIPKSSQATLFNNSSSNSRAPSAIMLREYRKENKDSNLDDSILDYKSNDNYFIDTMKSMFGQETALQPVNDDGKEKERSKRQARMKFLSSQIKHLGKDKETFMTACKVNEEEEDIKEGDLEAMELKLEEEERGMNEMLKDIDDAHSLMKEDDLEELRRRIAATRKNLDMHISTVCGLRTNIMALDKNAKDFDNTYSGTEYAAIKSAKVSYNNKVALPKKTENRLSNAGANVIGSTALALNTIREPAMKRPHLPLAPKTAKLQQEKREVVHALTYKK